MTVKAEVPVSLPVGEGLGKAVQAECVQATSHSYHLFETDHVACVERKVSHEELLHQG